MGPGWSPARRLWPLLWRRLVSQRAGPAVASVPCLPRLAERWLPAGPATCLTPSLTRGLHHGPQPEERTDGDARLQPGAAGTRAGQLVAGPDLGSPGLPCVLRRREIAIRADAELGVGGGFVRWLAPTLLCIGKKPGGMLSQNPRHIAGHIWPLASQPRVLTPPHDLPRVVTDELIGLSGTSPSNYVSSYPLKAGIA